MKEVTTLGLGRQFDVIGNGLLKAHQKEVVWSCGFKGLGPKELEAEQSGSEKAHNAATWCVNEEDDSCSREEGREKTSCLLSVRR